MSRCSSIKISKLSHRDFKIAMIKIFKQIKKIMKIFSRNMKFLSQIENIKIKIKNLLDEFNNRLK